MSHGPPWDIMGGMHSVDLVDETFIAAPGEIAARVVADPERWLAWWPKRRLEVFMDRGIKGQRWSIAGDLVGSAEIWLEAYRDGVVLHYYLRADPPDAVPGSVPARRADRIRRREALSWKEQVWALKAELEANKVVGCAVTR
jgi:hypothetical protein